MKKIFSIVLLAPIAFTTSCCNCEEDAKASEASLMELGEQSLSAVPKALEESEKLVNIDIDNDKSSIHYGIDISHYQGDIVKDLASHSDSLKFIICKASEGKHYIDPDFRMNWKLITQKGFIRGAYHFYQCNDDPIIQANLFAGALDGLNENDMAPILDIEQGGMAANVSSLQMQKDILIFLKEVERLTNRRPILYTDYAFAQEFIKDPVFATYPLWLADYTKKATPLVPSVWKTTGYKIWQKNASYHAYSKTIDFDVYQGDLKSLVK